jgi:AraC-like DNA-binding protein
MSVQLNILLLSLGALQGGILFLLLYKKRRSLPGYVFLAGYLWVMIIQVTLKIMSKIWLMETIKPFYKLSYYFPFLYGPLIWLFIKYFICSYKAGKRDLLHFLPAVLIVVCFAFTAWGEKIPTYLWPFFRAGNLMVFQGLSLLVYHYLAFRIVQQNWDRRSAQFELYQERIAWLRQFIISSFIVCFLISVCLGLMYLNYPHGQNFRFGFIVLSIFIYWISYKSWSQPELFNAVNYSLNGGVLTSAFTVGRAKKKYFNSSLGDEDMAKIIKSLENKLTTEKCYSNPELTIEQLATAISCSRHQLSQSINGRLGKSFYDYINNFRVEEAKILLADPANDKYKITALAYEAGFNSISTFNDVFKKFTSLTPSQFREQQRNINAGMTVPDLSDR